MNVHWTEYIGGDAGVLALRGVICTKCEEKYAEARCPDVILGHDGRYGHTRCATAHTPLTRGRGVAKWDCVGRRER